jgi:hypothetical protein
MRKFEKGDIVQIRFEDHAEDGKSIPFYVWGRVWGGCTARAKSYRVECWAYIKMGKLRDPNVKWFSIVKKTIDWKDSGKLVFERQSCSNET